MHSIVTADLFNRLAQEYGDLCAIEFEGKKTSFADLNTITNRLAHYFQSLGIIKGERVALLDKNSDLYVFAMGALIKIGAVVVPINYRLSAKEIAYIVDNAAAKHLIIGDAFLAMAPALREELPDVSFIPFHTHDDYETCIATEITQHSDVFEGPSFGLDDAYMQMYTSGTTGHPKGVIMSNRNMDETVKVIDDTLSIYHIGDRQLTSMPLYHVAATNTMLFGFYKGSTAVITREVDPMQILAHLKDNDIQIAFLAPVIIQFLLMMPGINDMTFPNLRGLYYGASPISPATLKGAQAVFKCAFYQFYGMTENMGVNSYLSDEDHQKEHLIKSCGKPFKGIEMRIADENNNPLPIGEIGEVQSRGPSTMTGYWADDSATQKTILADGWMKTGDAGYMDEDGYFYIHDRIKDMVISGGENIYPAEVEKCLMAHPDVGDVGVFGVPDEKWGETVRAAVVLLPNSKTTAEDIISFARENLAHYKCPSAVDIMRELPRNASGKVLRRELRKPFWHESERNVG